MLMRTSQVQPDGAIKYEVPVVNQGDVYAQVNASDNVAGPEGAEASVDVSVFERFFPLLLGDGRDRLLVLQQPTIWTTLSRCRMNGSPPQQPQFGRRAAIRRTESRAGIPCAGLWRKRGALARTNHADVARFVHSVFADQFVEQGVGRLAFERPALFDCP